MRKHSEVEVKFEAAKVPLSGVQAFVDYVDKNRWPRKYLEVEGSDSFYRLGKRLLRVRLDHDSGQHKDPTTWGSRGLLTVKARKSRKSLLDRHEVDIKLGQDVEPADVEAMFKLLGLRPEFKILKHYWIWKFRNKRGIIVVLAIYDVSDDRGRNKRRFLEIEVDHSSPCSPEEGKEIIRFWGNTLRRFVPIGDPLNISLQELYGKKARA